MCFAGLVLQIGAVISLKCAGMHKARHFSILKYFDASEMEMSSQGIQL